MDYLACIQSHLDKIIANGTDKYGPKLTAQWMASLDIRTGAYPQDGPVYPKCGKRAYRDILAPRGCTMYWDQPQLVACHAVSKLTGKDRYVRAADAYVRDFLATCVAANGLFEWGNHIYYDAFTDKLVRFQGGDHEIRPVPPAWELFWAASPEATEKEIRQVAKLHVFDPASGGFNRHADGKKGCAFLEAGGIIAESLCWLSRKASDASMADLGLRVARYSFQHRDPKTHLLENNPTVTRWDKYAATSEVGLWAGSLLRAGQYTGKEEFARMAADGVLAYLKYAWDDSAQRYLGQVKVADGTSALSPADAIKPLDRTNAPGKYANVWNGFFPTHDYPMALAEACALLYQRTGRDEFRQAVQRWAKVLLLDKPPEDSRDGQGGYAELFGRAIHFLCRASDALKDDSLRRQADDMARSALRILFAHGMFRGHAGEDRCDAVDGVGYLLLALIYLTTGKPAEYMGFGF